MKKTNYEKAFEKLIADTMQMLERNWGEHIYFENNPADPTLPRMMRDVNTASLREFTWLSYAIRHSKNIRQLTKKEIEKIVSSATPTSKNFSETHKQIVSTSIICPCCNAISMIVKIQSQGRCLGHNEESVDGLYRVVVDISEKEIFVKTYKLEEALISEKTYFIKTGGD